MAAGQLRRTFVWGKRKEFLTLMLLLGTNNLKKISDSHAHFHQNTPALKPLFTKEPALRIADGCPSCIRVHTHLDSNAVNARGFVPSLICHMNVTYVPRRGKLKYVHVILDRRTLCSWLLSPYLEKQPRMLTPCYPKLLLLKAAVKY